MTSTAVERASRAEGSVKDLVRSNWDAIKDSLPATMDSKRFARLVFNSVRKTPRLAEATATSLIGSLLAASALGLEVDTPLGEAYLLPYRRKDRSSGREWVEAQLIVGYQGIVKLYRQHPAAGRVASGWVGARDDFAYAYGTDPYLKHVPAAGDRGAPVAFWASYTLKDGTTDFAVLTPSEVRELRSKPENEKRDVADPQHWMERKTALKQALKLAPKSTTLAAALVVDEQPIAQAAHVAGLDAVVSVMQVDDVNVSTVAGEIEPPQADEMPADVDAATGEVIDPEQAPAQPAPAVDRIKRATGQAIVRELVRCGVVAESVDAYLPALGIPRALAELTQDEAVELLEMCRTLTRDKLADLMADAAGSDRG